MSSLRTTQAWVLISGPPRIREATALTLSAAGWNVLLAGAAREAGTSCGPAKTAGAEAHIAAWDVRDREATDHGVAQLMNAAGLGSGDAGPKLRAW